jgi:hypothetical protein
VNIERCVGEIIKIILLKTVKLAGSWSCIDVDVCMLLMPNTQTHSAAKYQRF